MTGQEIQIAGEALYESRIRALVDTDINLGKLLALDIQTGDFEIDSESTLAAAIRLRERQPNANIFGLRIGYDAVYAFGGARLHPSKK
jgi:hypothetical protein